MTEGVEGCLSGKPGNSHRRFLMHFREGPVSPGRKKKVFRKKPQGFHGLVWPCFATGAGSPYSNTPATGLPQFGHSPFFTVCSLTEKVLRFTTGALQWGQWVSAEAPATFPT